MTAYQEKIIMMVNDHFIDRSILLMEILREFTKYNEENEQLKAEIDTYQALDSHYDEIEEDAKWIAEENEKLKAKIVYLEKTNSNAMQTIKEQDETIDAQDDKINFYVAKMNESILKRQELEKENAQLKADLEEAQKHCKAVDEVNKKLRNCVNCKHRPMQPSNKSCQYALICSVDHDRWEIKE